MTSESMSLRANIAEYTVTRALRAGEVASPLVSFEYADYEKAHEGFRPMIREQAFDVSEMAIMTYLQAKDFGKPIVLLPFVVLGRFQHHCIAYNKKFGELEPTDLHGKQVAIRSYTQTTGVWVRGILAQEYGVDLSQVTWVCFDDPHVAEYTDPDFVQRGPAGTGPAEMLLNGEVEAGIMGVNMPKDERLEPLIPDPHTAALEWYSRRKAVPINHMVVVPESLSKSRPDVVEEIFRLLVESKAAAKLPLENGIDTQPVGLEAVRPSVEMAVEFAHDQKLISRRFDIEELFDENTLQLGH